MLTRINSGCLRAAPKSATYRSLRSILLAAQCRRQAKSQSKRSCAQRAPLSIFGWSRLLFGTAIKRGHKKMCPVALSRAKSDASASTIWANRSNQVCSHYAGQIEHRKCCHCLNDDAAHRSCNEHSALRKRRRIRHSLRQARLVRNGRERKTLTGTVFLPRRMPE